MKGRKKKEFWKQRKIKTEEMAKHEDYRRMTRKE
jgi:hypothetical protein